MHIRVKPPDSKGQPNANELKQLLLSVYLSVCLAGCVCLPECLSESVRLSVCLFMFFVVVVFAVGVVVAFFM